MSKIQILQETLHAAHLLKLLNRMYEYEMDPTRTVGTTEWLLDGRTDGRIYRQTDIRTEWNQYPQTTSLCGGINIVLTECNRRGAILVTFDDNQTYFRDGDGTLVVGFNVTCPVGFVTCVCIFVIWSRSYKLRQSFLVHLLGHQKVLAGKTRWHPTQPTPSKSTQTKFLKSPFDHRASEMRNHICEYENGLYIFIGTSYIYIYIYIYICSSWTPSFEVWVVDNRGRS